MERPAYISIVTTLLELVHHAVSLLEGDGWLKQEDHGLILDSRPYKVFVQLVLRAY